MTARTATRVPESIARSPEELAQHLSAHGLPGQRSQTAIRRLRRQRAARRPGIAPRPPVTERARRRLLHAAVSEVARRGGETTIHGEKGRINATLAIADRDRSTVLLTAQGWRHYAKQRPRWAGLAYLSGVGDAGRWAVRVPSTVTTVAQARAALEPAEVGRARAAGRRVARQGDIYAIETAARHDGAGRELLPDSHLWRSTTRYLIHRPADGRAHRPLNLRGFKAVRFTRQRALQMGRGSGGAYGD